MFLTSFHFIFLLPELSFSLSHACVYLMKGKGAYCVCGQFHSIQHGHLNHPIGVSASTGPVLVTLDLVQTKSERSGCYWEHTAFHSTAATSLPRDEGIKRNLHISIKATAANFSKHNKVSNAIRVKIIHRSNPWVDDPKRENPLTR